MTIAAIPASALIDLQVPCLTFAHDGTILGANSLAREMLGDATAQNKSDFIAALAMEIPDQAELEAILCDPTGRQCQVVIGDRKWAASCLPMTTGRMLTLHPIGATQTVPVAVDERKMMWNARSSFFSSISHEVRTPLNSIKGFAEIIALAAFGRAEIDRYQDYARDIVTESRKTLEAVDALITLSALESDGTRLVLERLNAADSIAAAIDAITDDTASASITVDDQTSGMMLTADAELLHQALTAALCVTARHAIERDHINVTIKPRNSGIEFVFAGAPIHRMAEEMVDEPGEAGLYIAATVAEAHGGGLRFSEHSTGEREIRLVFP